MPYTYRKTAPDQYTVYKKDTGKVVGHTGGTKQELRKYLAALHINESTGSIDNTSIDDQLSQDRGIKLVDLIQGHIKENNAGPTIIPTKDGDVVLTRDDKKRFVQAVSKFAHVAPSIYRDHSLTDVSAYMKDLIGTAKDLTHHETKDWFDNVTVGRHMKALEDAHKIFDKTAAEITNLQQRLEAAYDDIGSMLNKYYNIDEMIDEAVAKGKENKYQAYFNKALKKFNVSNPGDLATPDQRRRFFAYVDRFWTSEKEQEAAQRATEQPSTDEVEQIAEGKIIYRKP